MLARVDVPIGVSMIYDHNGTNIVNSLIRDQPPNPNPEANRNNELGDCSMQHRIQTIGIQAAEAECWRRDWQELSV